MAGLCAALATSAVRPAINAHDHAAPTDPISVAEKSVVRVVAISLDQDGAVSLGSGFVVAPHEEFLTTIIM